MQVRVPLSYKYMNLCFNGDTSFPSLLIGAYNTLWSIEYAIAPRQTRPAPRRTRALQSLVHNDVYSMSHSIDVIKYSSILLFCQ